MCVQYALCIPHKLAVIDSCRCVTVNFLLAFDTAMKATAGSPSPSPTLSMFFFSVSYFLQYWFQVAGDLPVGFPNAYSTVKITGFYLTVKLISEISP